MCYVIIINHLQSTYLDGEWSTGVEKQFNKRFDNLKSNRLLNQNIYSMNYIKNTSNWRNKTISREYTFIIKDILRGFVYDKLMYCYIK